MTRLFGNRRLSRTPWGGYARKHVALLRMTRFAKADIVDDLRKTERPPYGGLPEIRSVPNEEWEQPLFLTRPSPAQADLVPSEPEVEKEFRRYV